ncbi:hypothetical protein [Cycloclasticus pugetii]|uniref:hypothetical protein n=1 Tax=Cycloclasticus pugetii TaxID=34068 RepID=UPI0009128ED7|nr:hypothetical protein [Cycloclasticus pugetii]SHJ38036.1 hypothetical protein SAMN05519226_2012 [Cycloclasticus pugetii]
MKSNKKSHSNPILVGAIASTILMTTAPLAQAEESIINALSSGKASYSARLRYENVDQENLSEEANAYTARLTAAYKTGTYYGFGLFGEVESVHSLFSNNYAHPSQAKGAKYPVIADPNETELNQGYLFYTGLEDTSVKLGRQALTYRGAPFHRHIGTVAWRQNWQTLDAFSISNQSLSDTTINYAYVWNVNRIFGEDAPEPLDNFDSDSHLFNVQYSGFKAAKIEAYAYLYDFENADAFSTNTYGLRLSGAKPISDATKVIYTAEYATQSDAADNPNSIDADYILAEFGTKISFNGPINMLLLKASYELQEGNGGTDRFVTILGTNHAYQGWADKFLVTPGDGVEDIYLTAVTTAYGIKFVAAYHDLSSDNNSYDYGTEFDVMATKKVGKNYTVGLKYADYNADNNALNIGPTAVDTTKLWAFVSAKF